MRAFLSQLRTRLVLGALIFLLALTGAVILAVRDSLAFAGRNTADLSADTLVTQSETLLLEIVRREADLADSSAEADPQHLAAHVARLNLTPQSFGFVLDAAGRLLAVTPGHGGTLFAQPGQGDDSAWLGQSLPGASDPNLREVLTAMLAGQSATARIDLAGRQVVVAYAPLSAPPGSLALVLPVAEITAQAAPLTAAIQAQVNDIQRATLLTIGYFGALAMVAAVVAARALTRPVQELVAGTRAIAAGDLSIRLPATSSDELGLLAQSFNQMAGSLQARSTEVAEAYQHLEQRVQERTRELASLLQVSRTIGSTLELDPLLGLILEQLRLVVDYTGASIASLQDGTFQVRAYRGPGLASQFLQISYPTSEPLAVEMIRTRGPIIIDDIHGDSPAAALFRQHAAGQMSTLYGDVSAWMQLPLLARDTLIGTFNLHHRERAYYTAKQAELALAFADLAAVTLENARLYEQARTLAVVEERQRLARDLHDAVTQSLYSLTLLAEAARRTALSGDSERAAGHIARLGETAQQALKEMRLLVYQLRPLGLEQAGLVDALQHRLDAVEKRAGVTAQLKVRLPVDLPPAVEDGLYRIAQEALNNALKHSSATSITVTLHAEDGRVAMDVADNGRGFDPHNMPDQSGLGLVSLRERVQSLGGQWSIDSAPGEGTRVRVSIPA